MAVMREWLRRLWGTLRGQRADADLEAELRSHLAMAEEELQREGHTAAEAARLARLRVGHVPQAMERARDQRGLPRVDEFARNLRTTCRSWRRRPDFALATVAILALGLGSATALFAALDRVLFRPLPYADPDRLVSVGVVMAGPGGVPVPEFLPDLAYLQQWPPLPVPFAAVTTTRNVGSCDIMEAPAARVSCADVEANFLRVLGLHVQAGRDFALEDDLRGAVPTVLISDALWTRRFGRDPNAVGGTIDVDGESSTVVGVLPSGFEHPLGDAEVLRPLRTRPVDPERPFIAFLSAIARLKADVSVVQAQVATERELDGMLSVFREPPPGPAPTWRVRLLRERQMGDETAMAWLLIGAVAALLVIACVNVSSLGLARAEARSHEFAVRSALGAGAGRLAVLAFTEMLVLALAAGGVGLACAYGLLRLFVGLAPEGAPGLADASLDIRGLMLASGLTILTGLAIGCWPALSVRRTSVLPLGRRGTDSIAARPRARFTLVAAQIAITVVMLGGASLLLRSLANQVSVPLGFQSGPVVTLTTSLNPAIYPSGEAQTAFFEQLYQRARMLPGVVAAALSNAPAPQGLVVSVSGNIAVEGRTWDPDAVAPQVRRRNVTPEYFGVFGIRVTRGRGFAEADRDATEPAAVLSESLARMLFGAETAVGQRIRPQRDGPWHDVVGVVADVRNAGLTTDPQPELYAIRPRGADTFNNRTGALAVRTGVGLGDIGARLRQAAAELDPRVPVEIETLDEQIAGFTARPRFLASLMAAFAVLALAVAAFGLYSVAAYLVGQRTRDIGVRMALGATPGQVSRRFLTEAGRWMVGGTVAGLALSWGGGRLVESQLFDLAPTDGVAWGGAILVLVGALLVAVWPSVNRAARVNPVDALRSE